MVRVKSNRSLPNTSDDLATHGFMSVMGKFWKTMTYLRSSESWLAVRTQRITLTVALNQNQRHVSL